MKDVFIVDENTTFPMFKKAVMEGRKVIKVGNPQPVQAPVEMEPQEMPQDVQPMDIPQGDEGENQFDTNFDAGVEANEETDPKKFIQQLTGKLSQSLNSYNAENPDSGLSKYVLSMIITATCKNLDEKVRKELSDKVMTVKGDEVPEEEPVEDNGQEPEIEEPMNECVYTKKKIQEELEQEKRKHVDDTSRVYKANVPKAWRGRK